MPPIPEQCARCLRFIGIGASPDPAGGVETDAPLVCQAFPDGKGIPADIQRGTFDHTQPHRGDHGLRFLSAEE